MLGLGFDGAYRYNQKYIEECMRRCMEKVPIDYDIYSEPVIDLPKKKYFFSRQRKLNIRTALIASAVFMVVCFIVNLVVFTNATENYREILRRTVDNSVPQSNSAAIYEGNK
jgi:type VI protein secretion system component VasF